MSAPAIAAAVPDKHRAALASVVAAVALTLMKLVVGLATGSLGLLAEAAHSGLDLVAALVTLFAVRFSDRPADRVHQYGHGKIENLSALFETLLLLATCVWIIHEAIQRLFYRHTEVAATAWAFAVILTSIVVDVNRSRLLYRAARQHRSQALEADALHFSTDVWSSAVVLVGLALVWLGARLGPQWSWLARADAVAALGVACIVIVVSVRLGHRAVNVLLDAAPVGLLVHVEREVARVPGVRGVRDVRVRQSGASTFVDLTVDVDRSAPLEEAHRIATRAQEAVGALVPRSDVVVHVDPVRPSDEILPDTVSAIAARVGLRAHDVKLHEIRGSFFLDLHVEVPADLTLAAAHAEVSRVEAALREELPHVAGIHSHIEPSHEPATPGTPLSARTEAQLREDITAAIRQVPGLRGLTHCQVRAGATGFDVVLHCQAPAGLPVAAAHRLTEVAEARLRESIAGIGQMLIHVEPAPEPPTW